MDTTSSFLGFRLPHPFIAGASPLSGDLDSVKRLEDGGCAAVVLPSLFEEQIAEASHAPNGFSRHARWSDAAAHFPTVADAPLAPAEYAEYVRRVKAAVGIPVIGSLNGTTSESWLTFARLIEQAGADALELNMYEVVADLRESSAAVEEELLQIVAGLKRFVSIPIAVKLSPFFAAFGNIARGLDHAGADALVLFNRFYQPDIDTATMTAMPRVELSTSEELRLRLRWTAILHGRIRPALVVTGGVATSNDGVKALLAGANAVQIVSAILRHGPTHFATMRTGLERWMIAQGIERLDDVRGRVSLEGSEAPAAFERSNYIRALRSWGHADGAGS
ncbi:MAG: dihydroorotate dehydrogenase-like protein [Acidobacteriota bacterium]